LVVPVVVDMVGVDLVVGNHPAGTAVDHRIAAGCQLLSADVRMLNGMNSPDCRSFEEDMAVGIAVVLRRSIVD
jgi:hypothetical protein